MYGLYSCGHDLTASEHIMRDDPRCKKLGENCPAYANMARNTYMTPCPACRKRFRREEERQRVEEERLLAEIIEDQFGFGRAVEKGS